MKKIKVLEIVPNMQQGGLENLVMNILRNIDRSKYEVHFLYHYTSEYYFDNEILNLGGVIHKCSFREDNNIIKYIKFLKEFFQSNSFDIVHSHMLSTSRFTLKYAKKNGCKILINHSHNTTTEKSIKGLLKKIMIKRASKYANVFLACSMESGYFAYENDKFIVVDNCIDLQRFEFSKVKRARVRKELNVCDSENLFGTIGRLNVQKNHKFLLEAFSNTDTNNKLLIIGYGELKKDIIDKISELKINDRVILIENIGNPEDYYCAMDCFVLPSLFEGFPLTSVEAQANLLPCVFSNTITPKVLLNDESIFLDIDKTSEWTKYFNSFNKNRATEINENIKKYGVENLIKKIEYIYEGNLL